MTEGNNGPPSLEGKSGFEGRNIVDARKLFEQKMHESALQRLSGDARKLLADGYGVLQAMNIETDPQKVGNRIDDLSDAIAQYATNLDVLSGARDISEMSQSPDEPFEKMPSAVPPDDLGTIPLSVYELVMNRLQIAREFCEAATENQKEGEVYSGNLNAAREAAWGAIVELYNGMVALLKK